MGLFSLSSIEIDVLAWVIDLGLFIMHLNLLGELSLDFDFGIDVQHLKALYDNIHLKKISTLIISTREGRKEKLAIIIPFIRQLFGKSS